MRRFPLVALPTFIEPIRDAGYKCPAAALAELVDNALEAGARNVRIEVEGPNPSWQIRVVDDGAGMPPAVMQVALQFGGSTRFNSRSGAGRYGMGLPCSTASLARRIDVYSWTKTGQTWWTYLDLDQIARGELVGIPAPTPVEMLTAPRNVPTGTIVALTECDRLGYRRAASLESHLHRELGRIFRRVVLGGLQLSVNNRPVEPIDPLFLEGSPTLAKARPYGPPLEFSVRAGDCIAPVRVRFSLLPVEEWSSLPNEKKAEYGISKGAGVSMVRGGREVDSGWFFMGGKRRENYDDWWRCEVAFDPALDELFGLTHTKQKVNPTEVLNNILTPHIESVARQLNAGVRNAFFRLRSPAVASAQRRAQANDPLLEPPRSLRTKTSMQVQAERPLRKTQAVVGGLRYRVERKALPNGEFFNGTLSKNELRLVVNTDHVFYERLYGRILISRYVRSTDSIEALDLLLCAYARAAYSIKGRGDNRVADRLRQRWSRTLSTFLG